MPVNDDDLLTEGEDFLNQLVESAEFRKVHRIPGAMLVLGESGVCAEAPHRRQSDKRCGRTILRRDPVAQRVVTRGLLLVEFNHLRNVDARG